MDNQQRIALVRVGNLSPDDKASAVKFHLGDHLGSSNMVINDAGNSVNREEYTPYGETSFGSFSKKRYRFTGKERDEESGLYYDVTRYYAPWLGRWTSCDPARMADGTNLLGYARGDPINRMNITGMDSREVRPTSQCPSHHQTPSEKIEFDFARAEGTYQAALAAPIAPPDPNEPTAYRQKASHGILGHILPPRVIDFYCKDKPRDDYLSMEYFLSIRRSSRRRCLNRLLKNSMYMPYMASEEAMLVQYLVASKSFFNNLLKLPRQLDSTPSGWYLDQESRISNALDSNVITNVSMIDMAEPPLYPIFLLLVLNIAISFMLGLIGGLGRAFLQGV